MVDHLPVSPVFNSPQEKRKTAGCGRDGAQWYSACLASPVFPYRHLCKGPSSGTHFAVYHKGSAVKDTWAVSISENKDAK